MPATTFVPSTSSIGFFQPQPPSWANVEATANVSQQQPRLNDVFSGMRAFDPSEKPVQGNTEQSITQHGLENYSAPPARPKKGFNRYATGQQHRTGSFEESSPSSTSSEGLSGNNLPNQYNRITCFQPDIVFPKSELGSYPLSKLELYAKVLKYRVSKKELEQNGYPMFLNKLTKTATIPETRYTIGKNQWKSAEDKMRRCIRCHMDFELASNGQMGQMGCMYHTQRCVYNPVRKEDVKLCCGRTNGFTKGGELRRYHVYDQLLATELDTFIRTEKAWGIKDERSYNIFAIDCEMVYTIAGPALARLSVVDWDGQLVMGLMVKPPTMVIDPNTEYSGLTMEDIEGAKDTLESCRQKFMTIVNKRTILVGHSLESDLKALRLVHSTVVDTSLLYMSNGYKVGLKKLALQHLRIQIQSNNASAVGHDSTEDAKVTLKLLKFKMAECQ